MDASASLEVEVRPPSPYRLPVYGGEDRVMRVSGGVAARLLHVEGSPVLVRAWQPGADHVAIRAEPVDPDAIAAPSAPPPLQADPAGSRQLEVAVERMRFALGVDDDLREFHRRFRRDPLLGPLLRRSPHFRPHRRPWPWEALAWAVVKQLIESERAARIQRRIVGRWGARLGREREGLRDVPGAAAIAGRAPAELESMGLALRRAIALRAVAREVAAGRCDLTDGAGDKRLLAVPEIGPWTLQCLGLFGRGDPDSLPAGDLGYLKLVGRLACLRRRATVEEVEEFYAPYAPFRGLAGGLTLAGLHRLVAQGPPLRFSA
jgi:3-methyladenine DNA glycosylase/8-oxoguanine DNA glycosylase